ncbi:Aureusidin synthase [Sesamum angolense]|uniref:Aureusidin synthase n=1 Tax=Sesamum angolense TaxID=2727404 RepID=A0AAE2BGW3_9LAMI|nr:Aureusidin synthase [Sesamum angolense]
MAFFCPAIATTISTSAASCFPFSPPSAMEFSHLFLNKSSLSTKKNSAKFACKAKDSSENNQKNDEKENQELILHRRDFLLIGLSSTAIYQTGVSLSTSSSVSPDHLNCVDAAKPDGLPVNCCPPSRAGMEVTDYIPSPTATTCVRRPVHTANGRDNMVKYRKAVELMKQLPASDPRGFMQQANVHCAYCNGGYNQEGYSNVKFEVHRSLLFFPFHRWYLYFYERICRKLLQDETFALPFWNYDSPSGMEIPAMFNDSSSSLYDSLRNQDHLPPAVVDLNGDFLVTGIPPEKTQIDYNLNLMYKQMITNATTPRLFFGQPYRAGDDNPTRSGSGSGSIETAPHNAVHAWWVTPDSPS